MMKTRFTLRIEEDFLKDLKIIAINENISLSDFITINLKKILLQDGLIKEQDLKKYIGL